jgi:hypothetical protein
MSFLPERKAVVELHVVHPSSGKVFVTEDGGEERHMECGESITLEKSSVTIRVDADKAWITVSGSPLTAIDIRNSKSCLEENRNHGIQIEPHRGEVLTVSV